MVLLPMALLLPSSLSAAVGGGSKTSTVPPRSGNPRLDFAISEAALRCHDPEASATRKWPHRLIQPRLQALAAPGTCLRAPPRIAQDVATSYLQRRGQPV